ncbi:MULTISPECIES: hypothetical protein [unclassified Streptomyces]|uniref:hypothetical protein n=1 Tax=unclassified Streptomyces TaxID=2593676 RepID=UPI00247630FA|nr:MULTISPECIES: hypothetical protein [unclassified Streptomyces]MDH6454927.1 hypothetical protein [Streptomyces sp. SAI-119]MDH6494519.1 hypothetical protein [Streptomyces sp. SAI-149]
MTDSIAWLAEPQSIAWGGYSVVIAPDLESESLARRVAETAHRPASPRAIGELTGRQVQDLLEGLYGDTLDGIALRHGELDEWSYVIKYGGWQGEFGTGSRPVDRSGLHVFHLEYEEENGKPVPPHFAYRHDENLMCAFNLHLDGSWGHGSPEGDPEVATAVQERLSAAGLPDEDLDDSVVHRRCLEVLHRHFGLTLPRERILTETLPTLLLTRP